MQAGEETANQLSRAGTPFVSERIQGATWKHLEAVGPPQPCGDAGPAASLWQNGLELPRPSQTALRGRAPAKSRCEARARPLRKAAVGLRGRRRVCEGWRGCSLLGMRRAREAKAFLRIPRGGETCPGSLLFCVFPSSGGFWQPSSFCAVILMAGASGAGFDDRDGVLK